MHKYILFFSILILCNLVSSSLIIEPNPLNISVSKGIQSDFRINLTNNYNFDIYNLKFYNLEGFNFPSINISKQSVKQIDFNVLTNYSFEGQKTATINFKYIGNIPEEITTYILTITSSGINEQTNNHLTVRIGDSIRWVNNEEVTHSLQSTSFESIINPGSSYTKQFNTIGTFEYRTIVAGITFFTGTIDVINRTGEYLVTNPDYDFNYQINLKSIPDPTSLESSLSQKNYTIEATLYKDGLITITNNGSKKAESVKLYSDSNWITFDENNFDLESNDLKYIKFRITPEIFEKEQTNKTYTINIKIKAINTEEKIENLNVFIPYSQSLSEITTEEGFLNWFTNVYCKANPNNFLCNTSARSLNQTARIIYRESEFSVNMTGSEWYNLVKRIGMLEDTASRSSNTENDFNLKFESKLEYINNQTNQTANAINEFIKNQKMWSDFKWIIGIFLFICASISFIVYRIRKLSKKKEIVDIYDFQYR